MRVCVVGPGRIGTNVAHRLATAGHEVVATFSTDVAAAAERLVPLGVRFDADGPHAVRDAETVVISVPWAAIDAAWEAIGAPTGRVIVDTTNPFDAHGVVGLTVTSAAHNARRFGIPPFVKAFNTLTAGFQASAGEAENRGRLAMFYAASNDRAVAVAERLVAGVGFVPVFVGGPAESEMMEAPRRPGAVYGESYTPEVARRAVDAYRKGLPIPRPA